MTATMRVCGPRLAKLTRAMQQQVPGLEYWLWPTALHEASHCVVALSFGALPSRARVWVGDDQRAHGDNSLTVAIVPDARFVESADAAAPIVTARQRALISLAGAAGAALWIEADEIACCPSDGPNGDRVMIGQMGFKWDDPRLWREAQQICAKHKAAILRFCIELGRRRTLTGDDITQLVASDSAFASLRERK